MKNSLFILVILFLGFLKLSAQLPGLQPEQDCINGLPICGATIFQSETYRGKGANIHETPLTSCLSNSENNSVWYEFEIDSPGQLCFLITPVSIQDDYDYSLFNITANGCGGTFDGTSPEVRCDYAITVGTTSPTGIDFGGDTATHAGMNGRPVLLPLPVTAGQKFALIVDNFNGNSVSGFTLDFSHSTATIKHSVTSFNSHQIINAITTQTIPIPLASYIDCSTLGVNDFVLHNQPAGISITGITPIGVCKNDTATVHSILVTLNSPLGYGQSFDLILLADSLKDFCGNILPADTIHVASASGPIGSAPTARFQAVVTSDTLATYDVSVYADTVYYNVEIVNDTSLTLTTRDWTLAPLHDSTVYNICQYVRNNYGTDSTCKTLVYNLAPVGGFTYMFWGDTISVVDTSRYSDTVYYYIIDSNAHKTNNAPTIIYLSGNSYALPGVGTYQICQVAKNRSDSVITCKTITYTGINDINPNFQINISPNPTTGILQIELPPSTTPTNIQIFNVLGTKLIDKKLSLGETKVEIDLRQLPPATYIVHIAQGDEILVRKVVKY